MRIFFSIFLSLHLLLPALPARAETMAALLEHGSYLSARPGGQIITQLRPNQLYTPASIFKIITALASLEILGEGYRFPTSFHLTPALDLWIKGGGDP
ncbi:MAG: D-alanyl-D-alanine carboxypeptidase, partial [Desulfurivibrionaceae bacterium]|nr:D-alanyl-D-alanine carboxypeptidase [Desulfurivibrionaceae bacterium]